MNKTPRRLNTYLTAVIAVACFVPLVTARGQDPKITQTAGVDNTRMGAYRALAQLSFQAFQRGDNATAAELARVLERTWDRGEGKERAPDKPNHDLYNQIDESMDVFIQPIMSYVAKAPDPASVLAAYNAFLEKLQQAD